MKVCGVDLAGLAKNPTGFCVLTIDGENKKAETCILHSDEEIKAGLAEASPEIVAVDAPLTYEKKRRLADDLLAEYGALPVTLPGMEVLAVRGCNLAEQLRDKYTLVEVYAKASAKILGLYDKDDLRCQKNLMQLGLAGDVNTRFLVRDELDAIFAAFTGYLHLIGQTKMVGDADGMIVVPEV